MLGRNLIAFAGTGYRNSALIFGCLIAVMVWLGVWLQVRSNYGESLAKIAEEMNGLNTVLESHVIRTVKDLDRAMLIVRDYIEVERARNGGSIPWGQLRLPRPEVLGDAALQISLIDHDGLLRETNVTRSGAPIDLSERLHFRAQRDSRADALFIGAPVLSKTLGRWTLQLTRPLSAEPNSFTGVISGALQPEQLFAIYPPIDIGSSGSISVLGLDGIVRASHGAKALELGVNRSDLPVFHAFHNRRFAAYLQTSPGKDGNQFLAYRKVDGYPLILQITKARDEALSPHYSRRIDYYLFGAALTLIVLLGAAAGWHYQRKLQRTAHDLSAHKEELRTQIVRFDTALANMSQGLCMFDGEERLVVANDRYAEMYGLKLEQVKPGTPFRQIIEARIALGAYAGGDPQAYIDERLSAVRERNASTKIQTLPDGRVLAISHRPMTDGGWVATHEDTTELRRIEATLQQQNELLQRSEEELRTQNLRFDAALNNMLQGLSMFDAEQRLVVCNLRYAEMYRLSPELTKPGTPFCQILSYRSSTGLVAPATVDDYHRGALAQFDSVTAWTKIRELADGRAISVAYQPMPGGGWVTTHEDITERRHIEIALDQQNKLLQRSKEELHTQNLQFDTALSHMGQALCMFDREQRVVVCNERYAAMYGLTPEMTKPGTTLRQIIEHRIARGIYYAGETPDDYMAERVQAVLTATDKVHELSDGRVIAVSRRPMPGGGWVTTHEDITERRRIETRIAHMAHHDALTDLPNRALFHERLDQALTGTRQSDRPFAVLMLDLDGFKQVNDTLGHSSGDALLKAVAERLRGCLRESDTVARLGGDEFAIVQAVDDPATEAAALGTRILDVIRTPFDLAGSLASVGTSIGIAIAPDDGTDPDQLLKHADLALYRAKREGRGVYCFFEPEMDRRMQMRSDLLQDLRSALVKGEFELYYQPLVNLERDDVCGFEALLRWNHPELGTILPAEFIALAEDTGLIVPIGEWVLHQACDEAASWPEHMKVAVNLSPAQFKSRNLVPSVASALTCTGMAAHRLELEITESVVLQDQDNAFATLRQLHDLGVKIALDDFGTGYSSLSTLRKFSFDKIKIDRSFVSDLTAAHVDAVAIVRSVARLGKSLNIATTAEGVETKEQADRVRAEGCTEMQGYYICRPSPAREITRLFVSPVDQPASAA